MPNIQTVLVGGIPTACVSRSGLIDLMVEDCRRAREGAPCKLVFDLNGQGLAMARADASYRSDLTSADIVHADGQPMVLASRLLTKTPIPERTCTTDVFQDAAATAERTGLRFFLLGGTDEVNEACAATMQARYPGLIIAGRHHGYFDSADDARICDMVNAAGVDVLWVGLGKPREQSFCARNAHRLRIGWAVTCGGCFNYVSGSYSRAPMWMQGSGLEWLYRLWRSPKQFSWRYLTTNPIAFYMLVTKTRGVARLAEGAA